jgi:hypothetical protein
MIGVSISCKKLPFVMIDAALIETGLLILTALLRPSTSGGVGHENWFPTYPESWLKLDRSRCSFAQWI